MSEKPIIAYHMSLPLTKKNSTIDAIANEWHMTSLHFKTLATITLRAGVHRAFEYDVAGSFSEQYRRELKAALKYEVRYGC